MTNVRQLRKDLDKLIEANNLKTEIISQNAQGDKLVKREYFQKLIQSFNILGLLTFLGFMFSLGGKIPFIKQIFLGLIAWYTKSKWIKVLAWARKSFVVINAVIGVYLMFKLVGFSPDNILAGISGLGASYLEMLTSLTKKLFKWFYDFFDFRTPQPPTNPSWTPKDWWYGPKQHTWYGGSNPLGSSDHMSKMFDLSKTQTFYKSPSSSSWWWGSDSQWMPNWLWTGIYYTGLAVCIAGGIWVSYIFVSEFWSYFTTPHIDPTATNVPSGPPITLSDGTTEQVLSKAAGKAVDRGAAIASSSTVPVASTSTAGSSVIRKATTFAANATASVVASSLQNVGKTVATTVVDTTKVVGGYLNPFHHVDVPATGHQTYEAFRNVQLNNYNQADTTLWPYEPNNPFDPWYKKLSLYMFGESHSEYIARETLRAESIGKAFKENSSNPEIFVTPNSSGSNTPVPSTSALTSENFGLEPRSPKPHYVPKDIGDIQVPMYAETAPNTPKGSPRIATLGLELPVSEISTNTVYDNIRSVNVQNKISNLPTYDDIRAVNVQNKISNLPDTPSGHNSWEGELSMQAKNRIAAAEAAAEAAQVAKDTVKTTVQVAALAGENYDPEVPMIAEEAGLDTIDTTTPQHHQSSVEATPRASTSSAVPVQELTPAATESTSPEAIPERRLAQSTEEFAPIASPHTNPTSVNSSPKSDDSDNSLGLENMFVLPTPDETPVQVQSDLPPVRNNTSSPVSTVSMPVQVDAQPIAATSHVTGQEETSVTVPHIVEPSPQVDPTPIVSNEVPVNVRFPLITDSVPYDFVWYFESPSEGDREQTVVTSWTNEGFRRVLETYNYTGYEAIYMEYLQKSSIVELRGDVFDYVKKHFKNSY